MSSRRKQLRPRHVDADDENDELATVAAAPTSIVVAEQNADDAASNNDAIQQPVLPLANEIESDAIVGQMEMDQENGKHKTVLLIVLMRLHGT